MSDLSRRSAFTTKDIVFMSGATNTWTNMTAAVQEFNGNVSRRRYVNLSDFVMYRIHAGIAVVGNAGAVIGIQFSPDDGANWYGLDNGTLNSIGSTTQVIDATGYVKTNIATIAYAARIQNCLLRVAGSGGDGAIDPGFSSIILEVYK